LKSTISRKKNFEKLLGDVVYGEIGVVTEGEIFRVIGLQNKTIVEANIFDLKEAWQKPLRF
jgi:phosphoribosylformylglycinamidine synthase